MIVVLASRHDGTARALLERWSQGGAALLSCEDLTTRGWRWDTGSPASSLAVVAGEPVPCSGFRGVLMRRPCVLQEELTETASADRPYVAAEINAFLIAWLSSLTCPMLNRPTATCLSGPNWRPEQWVCAAASLGIPVKRRLRSAPFVAGEEEPTKLEETTSLIVVGRQVLGEAEDGCAADARRLADAAGVDLMEVRFKGTEMRWATCWPDLSDLSIQNAVFAYFDAGRSGT